MKKAIVPARMIRGSILIRNASEGRLTNCPRLRIGLASCILVPLLFIPSSQIFAAADSASTPPPSSPDQIHHLIEALGDADYFVRQKAEFDLGKIGFEAVEALTEAREHDDMEIAARAGRLLGTIRGNWSVPGDSSDIVQLLAGYDSQDDGSRALLIGRLIDLPDSHGIPGVCRIIRYERSLSLAKTAALQLLKAMAGSDLPATLEKKEPFVAPKAPRVGEKPILVTTVQNGLEKCRRAPARWVVAWSRARYDPPALAGIWTRFAAEEESLLFRQPRDTSMAIVESLLGFQIAALRKIGRGADAASSVDRLIKLRRGEPDGLARLMNWLIDQEDWPAIRLVENRCQATIAESVDLLYLVGEAQIRRGDAVAAEQSAGRAMKLNADNDEPSLAKHYQAGERLEQRGRFQWATKEWEHVIHNAPPQSPLAAAAARSLSELYNDLDDNRRAAETLGVVTRAFAKRSNQWPMLNQDNGDPQSLGTLRARMCFFEACHWKLQGDRAKQSECLDKALATQSYDIEVLIECYQLRDPPAGYHARICKLIEKRLCELREQIADLGSNISAAQPCNEFAWLVANTEGDLDEALRFAKRSLALVGGEYGAYCDTLARVYSAKGDYSNAVKHQTRAAELLPFNHAVQKQLSMFREKASGKDVK